MLNYIGKLDLIDIAEISSAGIKSALGWYLVINFKNSNNQVSISCKTYEEAEALLDEIFAKS